MKIGKVPENILKRSVFRQLKSKRSEVIVGPSVGEDCTVLKFEKDEVIIMSTDPITGALYDIGRLAVHITANDIATSGAEPVGIMVTILLPRFTEEKDLKEMMKEINLTCEELNIEVIGGHTEVTQAVNQPVVSITGIGKAKIDNIIKTSGVQAGQEIIMTKWAGLEGTSIIANHKEKELLTKYNSSFINSAKDFIHDISVVPESRIALEYGVTSMHDITEGGVFGALWEIAEASGVGLEVNIKDIPIKQQTIEICEYYSINPYMLISSGALLITTFRGNDLVKALRDAGIDANIIGKATNNNKRIIYTEDEVRYLEPPKSDELFSVDI